ncbi:MAG: hypothetical protein OXE99_13530 [Cellvibrionales bacterium]|nr:hypothetical protein [Cellvibrionales bacterium]
MGWRLRIALVCLLTWLTSCGFHLKGTQGNVLDTPFQIESNPRQQGFEQAIKQAAVDMSAPLTSNAEWVITIKKTQREKYRTTSSVTAERDRFMLIYRVSFFLTHNHNGHSDTFGPINIDQQSSFQSNETKVVSKHNEEEQIYNELEKQTARLLLKRATLIANEPPICEAHKH